MKRFLGGETDKLLWMTEGSFQPKTILLFRMVVEDMIDTDPRRIYRKKERNPQQS